MSGDLSRVKHISVFLGKLVLTFFICFAGFIAAVIGYNLLTTIDFESSFGIAYLLLFYLAIVVVVILSYKVLTSGNSL